MNLNPQQRWIRRLIEGGSAAVDAVVVDRRVREPVEPERHRQEEPVARAESSTAVLTLRSRLTADAGTASASNAFPRRRAERAHRSAMATSHKMVVRLGASAERSVTARYCSCRQRRGPLSRKRHELRDEKHRHAEERFARSP